jgi:2-polyprenyl-6-methoxyphenol hydroxylase-like FAD-dependent oxidoreductase
MLSPALCCRDKLESRLIRARYIIPGENGSSTPGERHLNLVWYYNCSQNSLEYEAAMTDVNGVRHQRTVPFGKVRSELWAKQQAHSNEKFAVPIKEIVNQIEVPFVTAVSDCVSPRASFYDGKLFLVGDALALFRPNVAQSTNQSALHSLLLGKYLQGEITLGQYESEVMSFAHTTLLWSRDVSSEYLQGFTGHLYHKIRHHLARSTQSWGVRL